VEQAVLAVAEFGNDVIYGVDSGKGFKVVAARLPSLELEQGWYGPVPKLIAVVGSDARPGQDAATSRADSLHLVGLDGNGHGGILGIPRDSWVEIDQRGKNKINAALSMGGPELMLETLSEVSSLPIEGIVLTGFEGFVELWESALGRAEVEVPQAIRDAAAKANLEAGRQELDGAQALAFSRARKTLAGGDLTRQLHGGLVLLGALGKVQLEGPLELPGLFAASQPWMVTDLNWSQLFAFAALAVDTPDTGIVNRVVPARVGTAGSASVVFLTDQAPAVFADLADGTLEP
jgi:LCP family protein required for cell wall assembly